MARRRGLTGAMLLAATGLLAGCEPAQAPRSAPPPAPRPETTARSQASLAAEAYYARVQQSLLANGLLRTDGGGPDVPFSARTLARNFLRIALYQEYSERAGRLIARENGSVLHRWESPIRYRIAFGPTVAPERAEKDSAEIRRYTARLARLTGLGFSRVESQRRANFHIFILNEDERRRLAPTLRAIAPGISPATLATVTGMERDTYCLALAMSPAGSAAYAQAIVVIRAEHPDLLRRSCIHEEIAQAMGLPNDSPTARPSIFNDDGEFGLLTTHDELLLRILYDRRLAPGMTESQARPIVERIAAELMGGAA